MHPRFAWLLAFASLAWGWLPSGKVRGVNLGSLFIIEPWMAQQEWSSMGCGGTNDEWGCVQRLGQNAADAAFQKHWGSWITKGDLSTMSSWGLNTIRIPVGYWIKEDLVDRNSEQFPRGGLAYLDNIVGWAADLNMYVIMDLHAAPGSQAANQQFTGHSTSSAGWFNKALFERTYQFLEWMTERIHTNNAYRSVGMLEVMNEPDRGHDNLVTKFYPKAWDRIRAKEASLKPTRRLHIQMMNRNWGAGDPGSHLSDKTDDAYDAHKYYTWDKSTTRTHKGYLDAACHYDSASDGSSPVIVGEWSLGVPGDIGSQGAWEVNSENNIGFYAKWFLAQAQAFERHKGWVYWSWKAQQGNDFRWSYRTAVERGVVPKDLSAIESSTICSGR